MKLKLASPEQVAMVYERDLKPSFPPSELKPLANIQAMCRDGCYQPWCLFDGEEIAGECFLWLGLSAGRFWITSAWRRVAGTAARGR